MSKFKDSVIKIVRAVPKGKVVSYGQVALMVGVPRAAIQVGWVLHLSGDDGITPWWRVINKEGFISTKCAEHSVNVQRGLLENDGVEVSKNLKVDMKKYRWLPRSKFLKKLKLGDEYILTVMEKYKI